MSENKIWSNVVSKASLASMILVAASVSQSYASDVNLTNDIEFDAIEIQANYDSYNLNLNEFDLKLTDGTSYSIELGEAQNEQDWNDAFIAFIDNQSIDHPAPTNKPTI